MKKLSILLIAILFCSLQGHAQFWISFGWNEPHCQNCLWMEQAIRMTNRQAAEYHKIIHRHAFMTGEVGTIIRIIRTTVRPMRAIVMKIIIGIANGNIRTIDGLTVSMTANGIPVNMIVLNHIITMAVHIMTMGSGSPANTIVRAIREAVPVPIITRISTIRTNLTRNVRIGIKTGITIGTNGLTRIARIAANVRVTGGA